MAGGQDFVAAKATGKHVLPDEHVVGGIDRKHGTDRAAGGQRKSLNGAVITQCGGHALKFFYPPLRIKNKSAESFYFINKPQQFVVQIVALRTGNALKFDPFNLLFAVNQNPREC